MSVYSVNVYPSSTTIKTGQWYYGAYAVVNASSICYSDVEWYSDNTSVASVNASSGYIYGRSPGTARIYARSKTDSSKKDYIAVTVTNGAICVYSISLNRTSISLEKGKNFTLTATVCPTNATNKTISWRSTNTSVATVSCGVVTAKAKGSAYIYAEAQDGSGEYARCYVTVTENVLVTSVTVNPASKTMNLWECCLLSETVCPTNATNKCVIWSSNRPDVVYVNPENGFVMAQSEGTAIITAAAQDGSGENGYCTITVNPPIAVTGVEVCPTSLTMSVGDTEDLYAWISPSNATNQSVAWCSSNPDVATVGLYTGKITAKKAGTTTIAVTTNDGCFVDSCTVRVVIDTVTIKKDGENFNKIVFHSSGKVWRCINYDMIFDENYMYNNVLWDRLNENLLVNPPEPNVPSTDRTMKEYTDEEIKLLYAIDPYGVAAYVKEYAAQKEGLSATIQEKDRIFRLLFNRDPSYFARTLSNQWYRTSGFSELNDVISESELYFGMHPIYDGVTLLEVAGFVLDVAGIVFGSPLFTSGNTLIQCLGLVMRASVFVLSAGEAFLKNELASYTVGGIVEKAVKDTALDWAYNWVTVFDNLYSIVDSVVAEPNYYDQIINYYANESNYSLFIELKNGYSYPIKDLSDLLTIS